MQGGVTECIPKFPRDKYFLIEFLTPKPFAADCSPQNTAAIHRKCSYFEGIFPKAATSRICSLISVSNPKAAAGSWPQAERKSPSPPPPPRPPHLKNITATTFGSRQQCLLTPVKHYQITANPLSHLLAQQISAPNSPHASS